ncbi:hypothetical protein KC318_g3076 [Hortaea werneckii]|uniref:Uncharacterized protein n=1 Tax=Hortaea werneckii TaxID=91943 RepID=A0A3M6ZWI8_HORWE|nr:hypothetical protein KC334_g3921 [Hortaea werneckii]KAI7019243.1 hypothetical protein KC355_g3105 [Hortaea werneckii]KAI7672084.1 hypothetical protein KC318_g3076 [Hortaea werneckii]RMY19608.1 hypothetical protein D0867_04594 [Hortaea werneckii]RMY35120.1 hypothetical protein D0866_04815 [Hortaea werneckii]
MTIATATQTIVRTPTYYSTSYEELGPSSWTRVVTQYADANNVFPIATYTTTRSDDGGTRRITEPTSTGEPTTRVSTVEFQKNVPAHSGTITSPACVLPSVVPQCQSRWDSWIAAGAAQGKPLCQAAEVDSAQCSTIISARYDGYRNFGPTGIDGWVTNASSTWWPATQSFAPGCSLGCQTCAITGDTVQVYYWPPTTATAVENGTLTASASHALSNGAANATGPVTAIVGDATLTSPTIYISYRSLYASNSCHQVGQRYSNTIIPLAKNDDLKSLAYHQLDDMPARPGLSGSPSSWEYEELPFNLTDLTEPVPLSIYMQLPRCQLSLSAYTKAGFDAGDFTCSEYGAYKPLIAIPTEVRDLDPAWASCTAWYGGAYDPPKALQGATALATPEVPTPVKATSASAGSKATDSLPSQTATPLPADPAGSSGADSSDPNASSDDSSEKGRQAATATSTDFRSASSAGESLPSSHPGTSANADPLVGATQPETLEASGNTAETLNQATFRSQDPDKSGSYQAQPTKSDDNALAGEADDGSSNEASQTEAAFTRPTTNALSILQSALSSINTVEDPKTVTSSVLTEPSVVNSLVDGNEAVGEASSVSQDRKSSVTLGTQGLHATPSSTPRAGSTIGEGPLAESSAPEVSTTAGHQQVTVLTMGSMEVTASATSGGVVLQNEEGTTTLSAGEVDVTFAGEALSLHPQNQLAVGSSTYAIPVQEPASNTIAFSFGGQTDYPNAVSGETNAFKVAGNTLSAGGPAKTLDDGHVVSAAEGGLLIDSTSSLLIPHSATAAPSAQSKPTLVTIAGSKFTASAVSSRPSEIVIGSHTLTAGGLAATINGQTISQASDGVIVADGTTLKVPSKTLDGASAKVTYTPSSLRNGPATITSGTSGDPKSSTVTSVPMRSQGGGDGSSKTGDGLLTSKGMNSLSRGGSSNAAVTGSMIQSSSLEPSNGLDPEQTTSATASIAGKLECRAQRWPMAIVMAFLIMYIVM